MFLSLAERLYGNRLLVIYFGVGIASQFGNYVWAPDGGGSSSSAFAVMGGFTPVSGGIATGS